MTLLTLLIAVPLLAALAILFAPAKTKLLRMTALGVTSLIFVLSLALVPTVQSAPSQFHFVTDIPWIDSPAVHFHVGVDGLNVWLIVMTALLGMLATLISWRHIHGNLRKFYASLLILEFGVIGSLSALDLFLFYVFWEVIAVPLTFLVGVWGREHRIRASVKYFLYAICGSLFMLASIVWISVKAGTFDYLHLRSMLSSGRLVFSGTEELLLFLGFFIAFAVKTPLFPLHSWMPDVHAEALAGGPVDIAAIMAKLGPYGMMRICIPLFPVAAHTAAPVIVTLAIISVVYFGMLALAQTNLKRLLAYSAMSHMGFVTLGIFTMNQLGMDGAIYLILAHGISSSALFMLLGFLYDRRRSICVGDYGGIASSAPTLATMFLISTLAAIGLPLLSNFVGEFLVLQGASQVNFTWAVLAALGAILSATYMLRMYQKIFFGAAHASEAVFVPGAHHQPHFNPLDMHDMRRRELFAVVPLVALMVALGIGSQAILPSVGSVNTALLAPLNTPVIQATNVPEMTAPANWLALSGYTGDKALVATGSAPTGMRRFLAH